jgi:hypothetical protein
LNHLNTLGYTLFHCGVWLRAILRETDALRRHGAELLELAREHRLGFWRALATPFLLETEEAERAVRGFQREFNAGLTVSELLCRVADSYVAAGRPGDATRMLAEAQELMKEHGDVYWEPELLRLRGRLVAAEGAPLEALTAFERAVSARGTEAHTCSSCAPPSTSRGCRWRRASPWRRGRCWRRSTACSPTGPTWRTCRTPARC